MVVIAALFAVVVIGAVPLGIARLGLGDPSTDRIVRRAGAAAVPAAVALAVGVASAPGPVALALVLPWQALTAALALMAVVVFVGDAGRLRASRRLAVEIAFGFLAFGAANATAYGIGFSPLGFRPTIVLLTAVHFHAAGFVLMAVGILAHDRWPRRRTASGVGLVAIGTIVTAAGFVGVPVAATVGALAVAAGGLLIGAALVQDAGGLRSPAARRLGFVAGRALFVSMPLAVAWVVGGLIGVPTIELDLMVRTHGAINALLVSVPAMAAWALDARAARPPGGPVDALDMASR